MKSCAQYAALLDAYVDGELSAADLTAVQAHLHQCPDCQRYVDEILAIRAALPDVEETVVPEGFAEGVRKAIEAASPASGKKRRGWKKVLAPLAACIALAVLVAPLRPWERFQSETVQAQDAIYEDEAEADQQTEMQSADDAASDEITAKTAGLDGEASQTPVSARQSSGLEQDVAPGEVQMVTPEENSAPAAVLGDSASQAPEQEAQSSVTTAAAEAEESDPGAAVEDGSPAPAQTAYAAEQSEAEPAWVEHDNVIFAQVAFLTQEEAGDALTDYTGRPYSDAERPEEGVLGTGYAMELADFERILQTAGRSPADQADPARTTDQCCIVVLLDEE